MGDGPSTKKLSGHSGGHLVSRFALCLKASEDLLDPPELIAE